MATPPDGSSANWSYGPAQGLHDGAHDPFAFRYPQDASGEAYPPGQPEPFAEQPCEPHQPYAYQRYEPEPYEQPRPRIQTVDPLVHPAEPDPGPEPVASFDHPLVRPYTMTGGRTRPRYQLAIEALVSASVLPHAVQGRLPEHQRICQLCQEIKSVAEISALLTIPLGVARILVADLAEAGLVAIHQPGGDENADGQPDVTLLERVLSGLRKL